MIPIAGTMSEFANLQESSPCGLDSNRNYLINFN